MKCYSHNCFMCILACDLFQAFSFNIYNMCLTNKDLFERVTIKCSTMLCGYVCTHENDLLFGFSCAKKKTLNILRCENKLFHFFSLCIFALINEHLLCESCTI